MQTALKDLKEYLKETLDIQLVLKPWKGAHRLSFFLQDSYSFYMALLLGRKYLFALAREESLVTPALLRKHIEQLHEKVGLPCVYVSSEVSSYDRKRLMQQGVQFIVPLRQIHLPSCGTDWQDRSHMTPTPRVIHKIMPSTQAVLIYILMHHDQETFTPLGLARALNYTQMTMTRALNELEMVGLGKAVRKGKERIFSLKGSSSQVWKRAKSFMQNPVKKRVWVKLKKNRLKEVTAEGALAGFCALAEHSMLSAPSHPIYAISLDVWKDIQQLGIIQEFVSRDDADIELEVWDYDPKLFEGNGAVDCYSLYLSLRENKDERVEIALDKLIKGK
jgi:hypothetical protein